MFVSTRRRIVGILLCLVGFVSFFVLGRGWLRFDAIGSGSYNGCNTATSSIPDPQSSRQNTNSTHGSIVFEEAFKNVGTIDEGKNVEVSFSFRSEGTSDAKIFKLETGCGCSIADVAIE